MSTFTKKLTVAQNEPTFTVGRTDLNYRKASLLKTWGKGAIMQNLFKV